MAAGEYSFIGTLAPETNSTLQWRTSIILLAIFPERIILNHVADIDQVTNSTKHPWINIVESIWNVISHA